MRAVLALVVVAALGGASGWAVWQSEQPAGAGAGVEAVAGSPVLSVRRAPEVLLRPRRDAAVAAAVSDLPGRIPGESCLVVRERGRTLVSHRPDVPLVPASTQKLLVGAALLELVGDPQAAFTTAVVSERPPVDGVVDGDVWLVGGGDPLLATEDFVARNGDQARRFTRFEDLADAIVDAGIVRIDGSILGDGSRYDDVLDVPTWIDRYREQVSAGPLSGLTVNQGLSTFTPERVQVNPGTPATDPPGHAASVLSDLLAERGVEVTGPSSSGTAPDVVESIADIDSLPLVEVVDHMMQWSDNTVAELLLKELGVQAGQTGSTEVGATVLVSTLAAMGVSTDAMIVADGSGLDLGNRVSCDALVDVLDATGPDSDLSDTLAVAGATGTLRGRVAGTPASGNVLAKTGSLRHVISLAGHLRSDDGRDYVFAIVSNVPEGEFMPDAGLETQDDLMVRLAALTPVEPPPEVEPLPARSLSP